MLFSSLFIDVNTHRRKKNTVQLDDLSSFSELNELKLNKTECESKYLVKTPSAVVSDPVCSQL